MKDILYTNWYKYIYYRANSKQIYIILYTWACCGTVCSLTVDVTTGRMLLYQVGRWTMGTVFLTAVAAEDSGTQHVVKEFSETPSTSEAPWQGWLWVEQQHSTNRSVGTSDVMQERFLSSYPKAVLVVANISRVRLATAQTCHKSVFYYPVSASC